MDRVLFISFILLAIVYATQAKSHTKDLQARSIGHGHSQQGGELYKKLVLTFDDGPHTQNTHKVLDVLKTYNDALEAAGKEKIVGTFFINGKQVAKYNYHKPNKYAYELVSTNSTKMTIVHDIVADNHILANHSVSHASLWDVFLDSSRSIIQNEIKLTHDAVDYLMPDLRDCNNKWFFRAPYGGWRAQNAPDANAETEVVKKYVGPIFWDIGSRITYYGDSSVPSDAADWECKSTGKSAKFCARGYLNRTYRKNHIGGIVLMHDIHGLTSEMLKYALRVWTGINPYPVNSSLYNDIEKFVSDYKFENVPALDIIGLNEVKALNQYDERFQADGICTQ